MLALIPNKLKPPIMNDDIFPEPAPTQARHCVTGISHTGKPCRLIDNTGTVAPAQLQRLLDDLIEQKAFGLKGLSGPGNTIALGHPQLGHIQLGGSLYRLIIRPYEARIEAF